MFTSSRNKPQLTGEKFEKISQLDSCKPVVTDGASDKLENVFVPCGASSLSLFNDSFIFPIDVDRTNLVNPEILKLYKKADKSYESAINWIDIDNQHFVSWIQTAAFKTFRKKVGEIKNELEAGDLEVKIQNHYPVQSFKGTKTLIISENSFTGGPSSFGYIFFFTVGGISLFLSIAFFILHFFNLLPLYAFIQKNSSVDAIQLQNFYET